MTAGATSVAEEPPAIERRWSAWLLQRNRGGTRTLLYIVASLYPAFGLIDYMLAPRAALPWLWATRALVTAVTFAMFRIVRSPVFERHPYSIPAAYMILCSSGITLMTAFMGGLASPYYAGLTLATVATGLLFVWPARVVITTHALIVVTYVVVNLAARRIGDLQIALMNLAFLASTAMIAAVGQLVAYKSQRTQMVAQLALEETTSQLQLAHEQLRLQADFKSRFFANMTHELRTPLAIMLAPLELVLEGELGQITEAQRGSFQTMFRNGLKLLKLINDLLDLSKLEESKLRLRVAEHDLVDHLKQLTAQTMVLAQRKQLQLRFLPEHDKQLVFCDLERLERVFVNLLSNAIKFTEPGGTVQVWLFEKQDTVEIVVEDDGPGFPTDKAEQLFERFYQVDMGGTRRHGGTGIGLALARELVTLHGGSLRAESKADKGARFTVELKKGKDHLKPDSLDRRQARSDRGGGKRESDGGLQDWAVQLAAREDFKLLDIAEASDRRLLPRDTDERRRRHTALIVEDTPDVIRLVHLALRRDFRVLAAQDGLKGLELAQREQPSVIITDLMMPGIDGFELTKRLREDPRTSAIPIIMLTARGDLEDRVAGLDHGINAYLAKPFSVKELLSTARGLVRETEKTADRVLNGRMDALEIVAAGLAHEINNPLNYVKNALGRVRVDALGIAAMAGPGSLGTLGPDEQILLQKAAARLADLLGVADSGLKRIGGTVRLMESYGRAGFSRTLRDHDVHAAVREVVELVLPATGRKVRVEIEKSGDSVIECVPEELHQLLTNLIQNAIEAAEDDKGLVRVTCSEEHGGFVLRVQDNGCGMSPEAQARLFTPFFTTKGPGKGTGMGLTISWRVVTSLKGTIEVQSKLSEGTEFLVRLPRRQTLETPVDTKIIPKVAPRTAPIAG